MLTTNDEQSKSFYLLKHNNVKLGYLSFGGRVKVNFFKVDMGFLTCGFRSKLKIVFKVDTFLLRL